MNFGKINNKINHSFATTIFKLFRNTLYLLKGWAGDDKACNWALNIKLYKIHYVTVITHHERFTQITCRLWVSWDRWASRRLAYNRLFFSLIRGRVCKYFAGFYAYEKAQWVHTSLSKLESVKFHDFSDSFYDLIQWNFTWQSVKSHHWNFQ